MRGDPSEVRVRYPGAIQVDDNIILEAVHHSKSVMPATACTRTLKCSADDQLGLAEEQSPFDVLFCRVIKVFRNLLSKLRALRETAAESCDKLIVAFASLGARGLRSRLW